MDASAVRHALSSVGYQDWRMKEGFNINEMGPYLLFCQEVLHLFGSSEFTITSDDVESLYLLETSRRFRIAVANNAVAGGGNLNPLEFQNNEALSSVLCIRSQWMHRVAAACGYLGAEHEMCSLPSREKLNAIMPIYGFELGRWVDYCVQRIAGSWGNLRSTVGFTGVENLISIAISCWSVAKTGSHLLPAIPCVKMNRANNAPAANAALLTIGSRREWSFKASLDYPDIWESGDILNRVNTEPNTLRKFRLSANDHDRIRNVFCRARLRDIRIAGANAIPDTEFALLNTRFGIDEGAILRIQFSDASYIPYELLNVVADVAYAEQPITDYFARERIYVLGRSPLPSLSLGGAPNF